MKNLLFPLCLFFFTYLSSQENSLIKYDNNGIVINAIKSECNDVVNGIFYEFYFLEIHNTSKNEVEISWENELWYNGNKSGQGDTPFNRISLAPNETIIGNCDNNSPQALKIFSRFTNGIKTETLSDFKLSNVNVKFK